MACPPKAERLRRLAEIYRQLPEFEGRAKLETWIHAITWRVAAGQRRRAHHRREVMSGDPQPPPDDGAVQLPAVDDLHASLGRIDDEARDLIALHEVGGLSTAQLSELTGLARATIAERLEHARLRLGRTLSTTPGRTLASLSPDELLTPKDAGPGWGTRRFATHDQPQRARGRRRREGQEGSAQRRREGQGRRQDRQADREEAGRHEEAREGLVSLSGGGRARGRSFGIRPRCVSASRSDQDVEELGAGEVALEHGREFVDQQIELDGELLAGDAVHAARDRDLGAGEHQHAGEPAALRGRRP